MSCEKYEVKMAAAEKALGMVSLISGIVGIVTQLLSLFPVLTWPATIVSLVCGYVAHKMAMVSGEVNGNAKIGFICGLVSVAIYLVMSLVAMVLAVVFMVLYFIMIVGMMGATVGL